MSNAMVLQGSRCHAIPGVGHVPSHGSTSGTAPVLPNYVVRRLVALTLAVAAAVLLLAAIAGLLAGFGGDPASASEAQLAPEHAQYHLVQPGDSLWAIASEHHGQVGLNGYLDALITLNGGTTITPGQAVWLP